jgi:hypothetical protein
MLQVLPYHKLLFFYWLGNGYIVLKIDPKSDRYEWIIE